MILFIFLLFISTAQRGECVKGKEDSPWFFIGLKGKLEEFKVRAAIRRDNRQHSDWILLKSRMIAREYFLL